MNNKIVITNYENKIIVLFIKNDTCIKIRALNNADSYSQTVYLGRVEKLKENIEACFVRYNGKTGFLRGLKYRPEMVLPVMVKKETEGNKQDEVTDSILVSGIYTVVSDNIKGVSFSRRLSDKNTLINDYGSLSNVIIRNNAAFADKESVINEYNYLKNVLHYIGEIKNARTENSVLYTGIPALIEIIFSENACEYDEIVTDVSEAYDIISGFFDDYKNMGIKIPLRIKMYSDEMVSLAALISMSSKLERATARKVYLKSDAYITIDKTEALTAIDVNSGTTVFKGDKAFVIHSINLEAVKEVALQLKLRNISGIIIVDFINEYNKEYKEELISAMNAALKDDDCGAKCHGLTMLGLVEISRKRKYKSLKEQLWK